ncbi:hypothetical protein M8C21_003410, partial [Ambrosia artemisiifolia]
TPNTFIYDREKETRYTQHKATSTHHLIYIGQFSLMSLSLQGLNQKKWRRIPILCSFGRTIPSLKTKEHHHFFASVTTK